MNDNTKTASGWCVLRTSPGRTLRLMAALTSAGYDAWTPRQMQIRRRPRSKLTIDIEIPIAPTFVFARAVHVRELAAAEVALPNPFPAFSLFRHAGRIPLISDGEVAGFRAEEDRHREAWERAAERERLRSERAKRKRLVMGQRVRFSEKSPFAGISGTVETDGDRFVMGAFGQSFRLKIGTWLLSPDDIEQTEPIMGAAA